MKINVNQIIEYAEKQKIFTTESLVIYLGIPETQKNALNVALHRLCDKELLFRYEPGIYGYIKYNAFAKKKIYPTYKEMVDKIYLESENGYVTGGYFLNAIGLTTWCPAKKTIVSNRVKRTTEKENVIIKKPKTIINNQNKSYLQLLDAIEELNNAPIDCENPSTIIFNQIKTKDFMFLVYLAENYYNKKTMDYIVKTVGREFNEIAR